MKQSKMNFFAVWVKRVALTIFSFLAFAYMAEAGYVVTYPDGKTSADPGDVVTITFDEDISRYEFNLEKLEDCNNNTFRLFTINCAEPTPCPQGTIVTPVVDGTTIEVTIPSEYDGSVYYLYYGTRNRVSWNFFIVCYKSNQYTYGGQIAIDVHTDDPVLRSTESCVCPSSSIVIKAENFNHTTLSWSYSDEDGHSGSLTVASSDDGSYDVEVPSSITSDFTITAKGGTTEYASLKIPLCIPDIQNAPGCAPNNGQFTFEVVNACPTLSYKFDNVTYSGASSYTMSAKFTGNNTPQTFTLYQGNKAVRSFTVVKCDVTVTCAEDIPSSFVLDDNSCGITIDDIKEHIKPTQSGGTSITNKVYYYNEDGGDFKIVSPTTKFVPGKTYVVRTQVYVDDALISYCDTKEFTVVDNTNPIIADNLLQNAIASCDESRVPDLSDYVLANTTDNCEVTFVSQTPAVNALITEDTDVTVVVEDASGNQTTGKVKVLSNKTLVSYHVDTTAVACDKFTWYGTEYTESGNYPKEFKTKAGCDSIVTLHLTINNHVEKEITETACDEYKWNDQTYTASGDYTQTFTAANGCDSIVTLHLTINNHVEKGITEIACDEYKWNDQTYTESGDYTQTFTAANGCDSIVTLHLTINNHVEKEITETACDSYTWNDQTYVASGDYTQTFTAANDCDSIVTLHLTINNHVEKEITETACDEYKWNDQTYVESGDYIQKFIAANGCDSIVTLHLTINNHVEKEITETACDSYTWNAETYTASGDYTQTFTAVNACDSIVTLHLTINNHVEKEITETACDSYTWNDQTYTASGDYTQTFTAANDCDSIVTLHLTINNHVEKEITETACDEYKWNDQTYTASGDYTQTFTAANDCDSIVTLHLTINNHVEKEITETACDEYKWNDQTYTASGDYTQTFTAANGCDSIVTLHLTINNHVEKEITETACDEYKWNDQTYTESGDYTQTFVAANDCDSIVTLHLTINNHVEKEITETACDEYKWNDQTYTASGDYTQTFTAANGCDSIVTLHLTINNHVEKEITETACDSYTWNAETYTASGDYTQTFTAANGCDSIVTLHLTINNHVEKEITETACDSYTWNDQTYTASGDYTQTFTAANGCDSIVTLHLTINNHVEKEITETACDSYTWNAETYTASGDYTQTFTAANGCDSIVTLHLTINNHVEKEITETACDSYTWNAETYTASGDYTQTFTAANGCDSIVTLHLTINNHVEEEISETACDSYTWNAETYTASGDYTQTFTAANDCDSIVTLHLTINNHVEEEITETACDEYKWNDQTYVASGDYIQKFIAANGCDSIVTLKLTINNHVEKEITETACDSYTWNDQTYVESGDYTQTFVAVNGCDSIVTLHLTINNHVENEITETACDSYTWNAETYTASGDYTQTFTAVNACDSIVTLHLTINNHVEKEITETACDSYTWNDQTYVESGDYTQTFTAANDCDSIVTLHLTINNHVEKEITETACDSYTWNAETYTASGDYTQTFVAANGCDSIVTLHLTINNHVEKEITETACDSYTWNAETYTESGDYTQTFTAANGCDSIVTLHLTINNHVEKEITETACDSYTWNDQTYTASGDYTQTFTAANDCDSIVTLHLTINNHVEKEITEVACDEYTWNTETYTTSGDYTQTFTAASGCDSIVTLHLTISKLKSVITSTESFCYNTSDGVIEGTIEGGILPYSIEWSGAATGSKDNVSSIYVDDLPDGDYIVKVTDANGCENELAATIEQIQTTIKLIAESDSKTYDGLPLTKPTYVQEGSFLEGDVLTNVIVSGSIVNAGIEENKVTSYKVLRGSDDVTCYYNIVTENGKLEIAKRPVKFTSASSDKVYDGRPLENNLVETEGLLDNEPVSFDVTGSQTEVGSSANTFEYTFGEGVSPDNYEVSKEEGILTVTEAEITLVCPSGEDVIKIYDGVALNPAAIAIVEGPVAATVEYKVGEEEWSTTVPSLNKVGTEIVNVRATAPNHAEKSCMYVLTVTPPDGVVVKIIGHSETFTYDGTEKSIHGYDVVILNSESYTKEDFIFDADTVVKGTDVGTYEMGLVNGYAHNQNPNYPSVSFMVIEGKLTIEPITKEIVITANSANKVYDGTPLEDPGFTYTENVLIEGDSLIVEVKGSITNVGSAHNEIVSYKVMRGDIDVTDNYKFGRYENGLLEVTKREVILASVSDEKVYDKTALENSKVEILGDGFAEGEGADFIVTGSQTEVGSSINKFEYQLHENTIVDNYNIVKQEGSLTVLENNTVIVTITEHTGSYVYNGQIRTVSGFDVDINTPMYDESDFDFVGVDSVQGQAVGSYGMGLREKDFVNTNKNFGNVKFNIVHDSLYILPMDGVEVTITEIGDTVVYDGQTHVVRGFSFYSNDKTYTTDNALLKTEGKDSVSAINVGSYSMNLSAEDFENINPNFTNVKFSVVHKYLVILPIDSVEVVVKEHGETYTYNGEVQKVTGYDIIPSTPLYSAKDFEFSGDSVVSGVETGAYPMNLDSTNFENVSENFTNVHFVVVHDSMVITPVGEIVVTIIEHADTFDFDGEEKMVTGYDVQISNPLYLQEYINFTGVDTVRGTNVGKYSMGLKEEDFTNENSNFASVRFEIVHDSMVIKAIKKTTIIVAMRGDTLMYNGQEQSVTGFDVLSISNPLVSPEEILYVGPGKDTIVSRTTVGESEMDIRQNNFVVNNPNIGEIDIMLLHRPLVIVPRTGVEVVIKENADTFVYDGENHSVFGYSVSTNDTLYTEGDFMFTGKAEISGTTVGQYSMNLRVDQFENKNPNFEDVTFVIEHDSMSIQPIEDVVVYIKGKYDTVTYDGSRHTIRGYVATCEHPNYDVFEDLMYVGLNKQATGIQIGFYPMDLDSLDFRNINPNYANVHFVVEDGYLQIEKCTDPIVIRANDDYKVYDGRPLWNDGFSYTSDRLDEIGDIIVAVIEGSITEVGTINNQVVSYKIYDKNGVDVTKNYSNVELVDGVLQVNPRTIILTSASDTKEYDGEPLTNFEVYVSGDSLAFCDTLIFNVTGSQLDSGSSLNEFTYEMIGNEFLLNNYKIEVVYGELTVVPNSTPIDIVAASDKKYYDKLPLENGGYTYTEDVLANGDSLIVIVKGSITDVGVTENVIVDYYVIRDGEDITFNYTFGDLIDGTLEVLYSEHPYMIYGDEDKIVFRDVYGPVRVFDVLGRIMQFKNMTPEFRAEEYMEVKVDRKGTYYVRVFGETIKVLVK